MAHLHRLIACLLLVVAGMAHAASCADLTATLNAHIANHITTMNAAHAGCVNGGSPESVCGANNPGGAIQTQTVGGVTQKRWHEWYTGPVSTGSVYVENFGPWTACTSTEQQTECSSVASALNYINAPLVHYGSVGLTACYGGYVISGSGGASGGGQSELYGPFKCSGTSASTCSAVPKPGSIVVDCPAGQYPGTVNGLQVCSPPENTIEGPKTTTATPPSGGASAPAIPNAPAGTTSQSEQVTCTGTICTKTTTYTDANGVSKGSKTEDQSKASYCAENPKAPGCEQQQSSFGGNCSGGFSCKGDAVQCALTQEVFAQNCKMNATSDESALYDVEKVKTGNRSNELPGSETISFGPERFDTTNVLGPASCIQDFAIVVAQRTVLIPISQVCPHLEKFGLILLACTFLSCAFIVFRD